MASHVQTILTDDITGDSADETVTFGLDGHTYEIDLSSENADRLRGALAEFVTCGRRTSVGSRNGGRSRRLVSTDTRTVRSWAQDNGYDLGDRGRIPKEIVAAYRAATG